MTTVLNNAANVSRYYSEKGEEVEIKVVAFNAGVNMMRTDKSPVLERLKSVTESLLNPRAGGLARQYPHAGERSGIARTRKRR